MVKIITSFSFFFFISLYSFSQKSILNLTNEVKIKSFKLNTTNKEISSNIELIDIKKSNPLFSSNIANFLQNSGSLFVQESQNGGGSPSIRGFEANRILLNVDGIRMNNAIFRGGHLQNILRLDKSQISKIEIVYGPSSVLYGSDAIGGVINLYTLTPQHDDSFYSNSFLKYNIGSNEKSLGTNIYFSKNKFASISSFSYSKFGDVSIGNKNEDRYKDWGKVFFYQSMKNNIDTIISNRNPNIIPFSGFSQFSCLQKFQFNVSSSIIHKLNIQYSISSEINRTDRLSELKNSILPFDFYSNPFVFAKWYYGPDSRKMIAYSFESNMKTKYLDKLSLTTAFQQYKESRHSRRFNSYWQKNQYEKVDIYSLNMDFIKTFKRLNLLYGIESVFNSVFSRAHSNNIINDSTKHTLSRYPNKNNSTLSNSIYIQNILTLLPKKSFLNIGFRFSNYKLMANNSDSLRKFSSIKVNSYSLNTNLGLTYNINSYSLLKLHFGTGFRNPNLDDISKVYENTNYIQIDNPLLSAEKSINIETSFISKINDLLSFEGSVFYTKIKDYISHSYTSYNGNSEVIIDNKVYKYSMLTNKNKADIYGFNASLSIPFTKEFSMNTKLSYIKGLLFSDSLESPLDHIPPVFGAFSFKYKSNKFVSDLLINYNLEKSSALYNQNGEDNIEKSADPLLGYTPGWYTLAFHNTFIINNFSNLSVSINNILNHHYRTFSSGISGSGRNITFALNVNF